MPLLAVLAGLLVALVIIQALLPGLRPASGGRTARARLSAAVARGNDKSAPASVRAHAFVEAGREALEGLNRPGLAARYARLAHDLAPTEVEVVSFAIEAMTAARRYVGLERLLWVTLDRTDDDACFARALAALRALYQGPLRRPERARVLSALTRGARAPVGE
jgi:hypothetical protein